MRALLACAFALVALAFAVGAARLWGRDRAYAEVHVWGAIPFAILTGCAFLT